MISLDFFFALLGPLIGIKPLSLSLEIQDFYNYVSNHNIATTCVNVDKKGLVNQLGEAR